MTEPKNLTIADMQNGDTGYGLPWGFIIVADRCYIDTAYDIVLISDTYLNNTVKISKRDDRYLADLSGVREYNARLEYKQLPTVFSPRFVECDDIDG